jgi:hypothetical protein
MWYGLVCDGTLIDIKYFNQQPMLFDFKISIVSHSKYIVVIVNPVIVSQCEDMV